MGAAPKRQGQRGPLLTSRGVPDGKASTAEAEAEGGPSEGGASEGARELVREGDAGDSGSGSKMGSKVGAGWVAGAGAAAARGKLGLFSSGGEPERLASCDTSAHWTGAARVAMPWAGAAGTAGSRTELADRAVSMPWAEAAGAAGSRTGLADRAVSEA